MALLPKLSSALANLCSPLKTSSEDYIRNFSAEFKDAYARLKNINPIKQSQIKSTQIDVRINSLRLPTEDFSNALLDQEKSGKAKKIGGAAGGAAVGFMIGGPVGAAIGGALGLVGGWLFGPSLDELKSQAISSVLDLSAAWSEQMKLPMTQACSAFQKNCLHFAITTIKKYHEQYSDKMSNDFTSAAQEYQARREAMIGFLDNAKALLAEAGGSQINQDTLEEVKQRLINDTFKVLIIGEFKRGKSTFINALLGKKILPSAAKPCTAIISEVKYGEEEKAIIHFRKDVTSLPDGLSPEMRDYINQHKGEGEIPPLTVSFEELKNYVTITDDDVNPNPEKSVADSPFEMAEIFVPVDLCKDEVEIIDSPGLNEHKTRSTVTNNYVGKADAIIFVLLSKSLAGQSEMEAIKNFNNSGNKSIFFVCNQFDLLDEEDEQDEIMERAKKMLLPYTDLKERGLHFVSSKAALKARTRLDAPAELERLEKESGFPAMEKELHRFLIKDRGHVKLEKPAKTVCEQLLHALPQTIEAQISALEKGIDKVQAERKKFVDELARIKGEAEQSILILNNSITDISQFFFREKAKFLSSLPDKMRQWVHECETEGKFGRIWTTKSEIESMTSELTNYASARAKEAQAAWNEETLTPQIQAKIAGFQEQASEYIARFQKYMSDAESEFSGCEVGDDSSVSDFLYANGIDANLLGDTLRLGIGGGIGAGVLALVGGIVSPWIIIPLLLASGGIASAFNRDCKMEKLKDTVGEELETLVAKKCNEASAGDDNLPLVQHLHEVVQSISDAFDKEIAAADQRAAKAEEACQLKGAEVEERKALLADIGKRAECLAAKVDSLISEA